MPLFDPDYIEFGEIECCAFDAALNNPLHTDEVQRLRKKFPTTYLCDVTDYWKGVSRQGLLYSKFKAILHAFCILAEKEVRALERKPKMGMLPCNHARSEHIEAIRNIISKILTRPDRN